MIFDISQLLAFSLITAIAGFYWGKWREYSKSGGVYELEVEVQSLYKENDRIREELYRVGILSGTTISNAYRALPELSVKVERPNLSLVKNEASL